MNLSQLHSIGAFVGTEEFRKTDFEWTPDIEGATPVKFEIGVKKEATVADFEFINMSDQYETDRSVMARTVHRMVRLYSVNGEKSEEPKIPLEECAMLKPGLLLAFFAAIGGLKKTGGKILPKARARASRAKAKS